MRLSRQDTLVNIPLLHKIKNTKITNNKGQGLAIPFKILSKF
nr:MAG TPA: hypothetical protein [Caudoviricetes sp.]